jgi:hypothetical protein
MSTLNDNALLTRLQVKNYVGINQADATLDNLIHDIINRVSTAFETYCSRTFRALEYTEYHDGGDGVRALFPDQYPINSITSIHEDSDWVYGSDKLIDSSDYKIMHDRYIVFDKFLAYGEGAIKLVYNAGYTTIPLDITQAAIDEVARRLKHRKDGEVVSQTQGDGTITYAGLDFLPQTIRTLNSYRNFRAI